jgi:hypothetical protein
MAARAEERAAATRTATAVARPAESSRDASPAVIPSSGLAGRWVEATGGRGRGNFAGFSTPTEMRITETATKVTIDTNTGTENQMQTAVYPLDGSESVIPGPLGWDTRARARWQDGKLVVTIQRSLQGPDGELTFEIRDVYDVAEGLLTLERTQGTRTQRTVFRR